MTDPAPPATSQNIAVDPVVARAYENPVLKQKLAEIDAGLINQVGGKLIEGSQVTDGGKIKHELRCSGNTAFDYASLTGAKSTITKDGATYQGTADSGVKVTSILDLLQSKDVKLGSKEEHLLRHISDLCDDKDGQVVATSEKPVDAAKIKPTKILASPAVGTVAAGEGVPPPGVSGTPKAKATPHPVTRHLRPVH